MDLTVIKGNIYCEVATKAESPYVSSRTANTVHPTNPPVTMHDSVTVI